MPASVLVPHQPWRSGVSGTIWNGAVGIAGGSRLEWRVAPLRSLISLGIAADYSLYGLDNARLDGQLLRHISGRTVLDNNSGSAHASILSAILPSIDIQCDSLLQIDMKRIALGSGEQGMDGRVVTDPGTCRATTAAGPATAVPSLLFTAEKVGAASRLTLAPATQRRQLLLDASLQENGTVDLQITQEGATRLPFLGIPSAMRVEGSL